VVQRAVDHHTKRVIKPSKKESNKFPLNKQEDDKLMGTLFSVFFVIGFIAFTWIAMFITYSSKL
jgi:hypothetical protein